MLASLRLLCRGASFFHKRVRQGVGASILAMGLALLTLAGCGSEDTLVLATTTSTYDSGLLQALLPPFERANGVTIKVVAVGSGEALEMGRRGDADVVLAHAPALEEAFMAQGFGVDRQAVMHNDFLLLGATADPARARGLKDAAQAFRRIAEAKATFVSRGDNSGTHSKEKQIWKQAGLSPSASDSWYLSAGQGMGETLALAQEKAAYTLTDRGTYLALRSRLDLDILVEGDEVLLNPYHVMAVNPEKVTVVKNYRLAKKLLEYLTSPQGQKIIADFGKDKFGEPLFFPDALPEGR